MLQKFLLQIHLELQNTGLLIPIKEKKTIFPKFLDRNSRDGKFFFFKTEMVSFFKVSAYHQFILQIRDTLSPENQIYPSCLRGMG